LESKVNTVLSDFNRLQESYVEDMRHQYIKEYNQEKLVMHTYEWLTKLEGFYTE
jgi:hypothetical protein